MMQQHRFRIAHRCVTRLLLTALAVLGASTDWAADAAALIHPLDWPQSGPTVALDAKTEQLVDQLVGRMSNEEKVGQLIQADIGSIRPEDLRKYKLGSILAGGNSAPGDNVRSSAGHWLDLVDAFFHTEPVLAQ